MASQKQARRGTRGAGQARSTGRSRGAGQAGVASQARGQARSESQAQGGSRARGQARSAGQAARSAAQGMPVTEAVATRPAPAQPAASRVFQLTTLVLALSGLGVSVYLTIAHLSGTGILACPDRGFINCDAVTTSPQANLFGVFPVAELGLAFYVFMVAITLPWAWKSRLPQVYWVRLAAVVAGMVFVLWLVYAELLLIKNLCLWCTTVHVITFLLFALLVFHAAGRSAPTAAGRAALTPASRSRG